MVGLWYLGSIVFALVLMHLLYRVRHSRVAHLLIMGTLFVLFWLVMEALSAYGGDEPNILRLQQAKLVSAMMIPPLYLLFALEFHQIPLKLKKLKYLVYLVPLLSLMSMLTQDIPYPFAIDISLVYWHQMPLLSLHPDIGFYIHTAYSYLLTSIVCVLFFIRAIRSTRFYRTQSTFIFFGTTITFGINLMFVRLHTGPDFMDTTPITMLITLFILYWGVFILPRSTISPIARKLIVENLSEAVFLLDASGRIIDMNPKAVEVICDHHPMAQSMADLNRKSPKNKQLYLGSMIDELLYYIPEITHLKNTDEQVQDIILEKGDALSFYSMEHTPIFHKDGSLLGRILILHDVTELSVHLNRLKLLNEALVLSDRILESALEGVAITDVDANIVKINKSFERISGYSEEELLGQNPRLLKSGRHDRAFYEAMWRSILDHGYWEGEIWDRKKDGEEYPKWMSITSLKNNSGETQNYIAISTDLSKIKKTEHDLFLAANFDHLTGLPNKPYFIRKLEDVLIRSRSGGKSIALLFIDIDDFKVINDSLGHKAGDDLLKEVSRRIVTQFSRSETVARYGGDEFVIILENVLSDMDVAEAASQLVCALNTPYTIMSRTLSMSVSVGVALAPNDESTVEGLIRKADAAMHESKENGKNRYSFSSEAIERKNHERLDMQIKLQNAIEQQQFSLNLQPIIKTKDGRWQIDGAEALIRWTLPSGEQIPPSRFIPFAENNDMIITIGRWIVQEIYRIDRVLKSHGHALKLSINVSTKQFINGEIVETLKRIKEQHADQQINLVVEITESLLFEQLDQALLTLQQIRGMGIKVALDDFGTGFSSLSYLTRLPIDYLKIDKSFVDGVGIGEKNITSDIISMARNLGLKTVAEGVEADHQASWLIDENCDALQGYFFSRPLPLEAFIAFADNLK